MALFAGVVAAFATCAAFAQEAQQAPKTVPAQAAAQMPPQAQGQAEAGMAQAPVDADGAQPAKADADADAKAKAPPATQAGETPQADPRR
jgi:hypothetical protein